MTDSLGSSVPSLPPRVSSAASSGAAGALREGLVANAVQFLRHPNVVGTPLARRIAFLKRKGLTSSEIDSALRQASASLSEAGSKASSSSVLVTVPSESSSNAVQTSFWGSWKGVVCTVVIAAGVGCAAAFTYDQYVKPWLKKRQASSEPNKEDDDNDDGDDNDDRQKSTRELLEEVRRNQQAMMRSISQLTSALDSRKIQSSNP